MAQNSDAKAKPRGLGRPIQKGQVLNPGGRPKEVAHVKELARQWTTEAVQTLAVIMKDESAPHSARVKASESLLDRAWGKAEATVNVKDVRDVRDLSTAEILAALATVGVAGAEAVSDESRPIH
jgi:hypothetical protein